MRLAGDEIKPAVVLLDAFDHATFGFFNSLNFVTYLARTRTDGRSGDDGSYRVEMDYNGWIMLEARTDPADPVAALTEQREIFEEMVAAAIGSPLTLIASERVESR